MRIIRYREQSYQPASHERPTDPGVLKKVMVSRGQLAEGIIAMVNWALLPAGRSFAPHYHEDMQEVFVMTHGTARMIAGGVGADLQEGDVAIVDEGEMHEMANEGNQEVRYLVFGISRNRGGKTVVADTA